LDNLKNFFCELLGTWLASLSITSNCMAYGLSYFWNSGVRSYYGLPRQGELLHSISKGRESVLEREPVNRIAPGSNKGWGRGFVNLCEAVGYDCR
jgi:hypothetical protein